MRLIHLLFITVLILPVGCLPSDDEEQKRQEALGVLNESVDVIIANRTFRIPRKYIHSANVGLNTKEIHDSVFIKLVLPDFTAKQDLTSQAEYDAASRAQRFAGLYLGNAASKISLEKLVRLRERRVASRFERTEPIHGLDSYNLYLQFSDEERLWSTFYIDKNTSGEISTVIECATFERNSLVKYPGCDMNFIHKGVWYDFHIKCPSEDFMNRRNRLADFGLRSWNRL